MRRSAWIRISSRCSTAARISLPNPAIPAGRTAMPLLDSQALLWLLDDNPRLGPRARQLITSAQGVHVSAVTVWELTIKTMLGKLSIPADFSKRLTAQGLVPLSINAENAAAISDFPAL